MTIDDAELPIERSERMEIVLRKDHDEIVARLRAAGTFASGKEAAAKYVECREIGFRTATTATGLADAQLADKIRALKPPEQTP